MLDNNELVNMLRGVIQEEMQSVRQEMRTIVQEELKPVRQELQELRTDQQGLKQSLQELRTDQQGLKQGLQELRTDQQGLKQGLQELRTEQQELKQGQVAIVAAINDLRAVNRLTHKKIFAHLDAIWEDIRSIGNRLEIRDEKDYSHL